jgi:hypothetical protein
MNRVLSAAAVATLMSLSARATVLMQYDATTGTAPDDEGWTRSGLPMINIGNAFLLQDWTFDNPTNNYGEYISQQGALPAGTFKKGGGAYGIEVKVRPLNDVAFVGYAWPELYLTWWDDVNNYNITIDQFSESNTSGLGDVVYGQSSFSKAISGIDWSVPHTIFIGHRASGSDSIFDFYLDGVIKKTVVEGSIARTGAPLLHDRLDFGDGTTGGLHDADVGAEWYFVKVHDTNVPVVPPSMWNVNGGGSFGVASNWTSGVPDANNGIATASFGSIITSAATINMEAQHIVGAVNFDNANRYTLAGSGTLGFSFPGTAQINVVSGSHTISAPVNFTSPLNVTVSTGNTLTINASSITSGPGATMYKSGDGVLELTHVRGHRLQVDAGAVKMLAGATNNSSAGASKVNDLIIAGGASPTATLDLSNNVLIINYSGSSPAASVRDQIRAGFNAGDWQGLGITSSKAALAAATSVKTAIGYAESSSLFGSFPGSYAGQTIDDNTTLILKYTLSGDANFDEKVNTLDFNLLAGGFGSGSTWQGGDFNYDGVVDSADFSALVGNFGRTLPASASLGAVVPEPMSVSLIVLGAMLVRRRR